MQLGVAMTISPKPRPASLATPPDAPTDDALLARIVAREHAAFALLVQRHTRRYYAVAYRCVFQRAEAEDIVQLAFLKLWENPAGWRKERGSAFTTWFYRVVINLCRDHLRRKRPLPLPEGFDAEDGHDNAEAMLTAEQQSRAVEMALRALPERQRTALVLCFYEGLSHQEAATVMGVRIKALQSLLMRGKTTLKEKLHDYA